MAGKTYQDFLNFRNRELAKIAGTNAKGYHVFDNELAKKIYDAKPSTMNSLAKIPGFPMTGERMKKYGTHIVNWFKTSSLF